MSVISGGYDCTSSNLDSTPQTRQLAGYTTGTPDIKWTAAQWAKFPKAIRICQDAGASDTTADVLDVETGAATNAEAAAWYKAALANYNKGVRPGQRYPCIYTSAGNVTALVNLLIADGVTSGPKLWVAHWDITQLIAEGYLLTSGGPFPIVGMQYSDGAAKGVNYDFDVWLNSWLNAVSPVDPPPAPEPSFPVPGGFSDRAEYKLLIEWSPVAGASKYLYQVEVATTGGAVIVPAGVVTATSVLVPVPSVGAYRWRVATAGDASHKPSAYSAWQMSVV